MFTANHGLNNPEFAIFTVTQVGVEWFGECVENMCGVTWHVHLMVN